MSNRNCYCKSAAFTVIELLVVISIISLLIGILLPSLSRARALSKCSKCAANLRQIGVAIQQYAMDNKSAVPTGPDTPLPYFPARKWNEWASNQLWVGTGGFANGLGVLMPAQFAEPSVLYCPGDDSSDVQDEKAKAVARGDQDAYCSYFYRQLDQTTRNSFDDLGNNALGLAANALAFDANSLGAPSRTNHDATRVSIVFRDTHAATFTNTRDVFTLRAADFAGFPASVDRRLDEILCAADFAEHGDPTQTPPLP